MPPSSLLFGSHHNDFRRRFFDGRFAEWKQHWRAGSPGFKLVLEVRRLRVAGLAERDDVAGHVPVAGARDVAHRDIGADIWRLTAAVERDGWDHELTTNERSGGERMRKAGLPHAGPRPLRKPVWPLRNG